MGAIGSGKFVCLKRMSSKPSDAGKPQLWHIPVNRAAG
jgi:hypothetical protein